MLANIINKMKAGGFYQNIMASGSEMDRVKSFLHRLESPPINAQNIVQRPIMPCFPGISNHPLYDPTKFEAVNILENNAAVILQELNRVNASSLLTYHPRGKPINKTSMPVNHDKQWRLLTFYYMGVENSFAANACPQTFNLLRSLPEQCCAYPWGDALFSIQHAHAHVAAHCSIDNLRVRIHLGLSIPLVSKIRIANEHYHWQEGKCLVFNDSFEHEVWNDSNSPRSVLIVDLWHPELTQVEKEALIAGFNKWEVKQLFYKERIDNTDASNQYQQELTKSLRKLDESELIQNYWNINN